MLTVVFLKIQVSGGVTVSLGKELNCLTVQTKEYDPSEHPKINYPTHRDIAPDVNIYTKLCLHQLNPPDASPECIRLSFQIDDRSVYSVVKILYRSLCK